MAPLSLPHAKATSHLAVGYDSAFPFVLEHRILLSAANTQSHTFVHGDVPVE